MNCKLIIADEQEGSERRLLFYRFLHPQHTRYVIGPHLNTHLSNIVTCFCLPTANKYIHVITSV